MADLKTIALFSADDWRSACLTLRVLGPARELGLQVLPGSTWQAQALVDFKPQTVDEAELVIIQRDFPRYAPAYETVMARATAAGKPVLYELDDQLFEVPPEHPVYQYYCAARIPMLRAVLEADAVTVSTRALADYLRPFNANLQVLPNRLDDSLWLPMSPVESSSGPVVIGCMGSFTHSPDVQMIEPVLQDCLDQFGQRVRLVFWSQSPPPASLAARDNVEWVNVAILDYAEFAAYFLRQKCDIALAPLRRSVFNEGKSPIKFLEYSALGAAGIYSRLAPYEGVVTDGRDGFLAATLSDWQVCLARLIEDPALRHQMACAAQQTVRDHWLLSHGAKQWADAYRAIVANGARGRPAGSLATLQLVQRWMDEQEADLRRQSQERVAQLTGGPAWQMAQKLSGARASLAPTGSRRQRWLDWLLGARTSAPSGRKV